MREIMKIFISTQNMENYGAHSWDGEGECPQYWKYKGGENYVVFVKEDEDAEEVLAELKNLIEYSNDAIREYIRNYTVFEDDEKLPFEIAAAAYEPTVTVERNTFGKLVVTRSYLGKAWYGSQDYSGKVESWVMLPEGGRHDYSCHYIRNLLK